jgi:hypothetical protein
VDTPHWMALNIYNWMVQIDENKSTPNAHKTNKRVKGKMKVTYAKASTTKCQEYKENVI